MATGYWNNFDTDQALLEIPAPSPKYFQLVFLNKQ